ncbi:MAG: hypothetical protein KJN98_06930, partial [Pontiella sp.]|nr:hypothetical protein [Pontiella sp.]
DSGSNVQSYMKICNDIYGPDRSKYPTINVVLMERSGANPEGLSRQLDRYMPILNAFRGQYEVVQDIRALMTPEERDFMESLPGVF